MQINKKSVEIKAPVTTRRRSRCRRRVIEDCEEQFLAAS